MDKGQRWTVALDGGTTNTRARLMDGRRIVATARRGVGVRDAVLVGDARRAALVRAVREVIEEVGRDLDGAGLVAAGMLSSEVGLVAVPHVEAPAGLDDLARAAAFVEVPEAADRPILVVPGVRTPTADGPGDWVESDVMRGEECETLGALAALVDDGRLGPGEASLFLWPGSHTKLVAVGTDGRIAGSFTTLAGELIQAVAQHTLVAASLPAGLPNAIDADAAAEGARAASRYGIGRAAFLVRIAAMRGALDERGRGSFWIGAAVAADVESLLASRLMEPGRPIWVGGRQPLRTLYADGLARRHDGPVHALDDPTAEAASALGALAVAERRRALDGEVAG